jgi:hypothetical protein
LAGKAKQHNKLAGYERAAIFGIGRRLLRNKPITDKQAKLLENLIRKSIYEDLVELPCRRQPCTWCDSMKRVVTDEHLARAEPKSETSIAKLIPPDAICHVAEKMKSHGTFTSYETGTLMSIGKRLARGLEVPSQQLSTLESLLVKALKSGVIEAQCETDGCDLCEVLRNCLSSIDLADHLARRM